jgi:hypothetical protein
MSFDLNPINWIKNIFSSAETIIDECIDSEEEKGAVKAALAKIQLEGQLAALRFQEKIVDGKTAVMVAELNQSDKYTKRARPTIIYVGLGIIVMNHVVNPYVQAVSGITLPVVAVPDAFWYAWGGVAGTFAYSRGKEKIAGMK